MPGYTQQAANLATPTPSRGTVSTSPIRDRISSIEEASNHLHASVSLLEERLEPTLSPTLPAGIGGAATEKTSPPRSHLLDRLHGIEALLFELGRRLDTLRERVEV